MNFHFHYKRKCIECKKWFTTEADCIVVCRECRDSLAKSQICAPIEFNEFFAENFEDLLA